MRAPPAVIVVVVAFLLPCSSSAEFTETLSVSGGLSSDPSDVGTVVTVAGYVRYNDTFEAVPDAEVTVYGPYISTMTGTTDENGRYSINFQAPIEVVADVPLMVEVFDPSTGKSGNITLEYDVVPTLTIGPPPPPPTPWWLVIGVLGTFITVAVVVSVYFVMREERGPGGPSNRPPRG